MSIKDGDQVAVANFRGMIMMWAGAIVPAEFLLCDGQAVSRTTYADLYAVIGDTFGEGDGSSTFNVPDLRGRVPMGAGTSTYTIEDELLPAAINTGSDLLEVGDASKYKNAEQITVIGDEDAIGVNARGLGFLTISSSGWFSGGNMDIAPLVGTKVCVGTNGNTSGIVGLKWVSEVNAAKNQFRISNTQGGATVTSASADGAYTAVVDQSNTDGESDLTSWSQTGDAWSLGGNAMPAVGDKIYCTTESSTSPNVGSTYTVQSINVGNSTFYTGNLGSDSGSVRWMNLGQNNTIPFASATGEDYYVVQRSLTEVSLALTADDAIAGNFINITYAGITNTTLRQAGSTLDKPLGQAGGQDEHKLSVSQMPAHTHDVLQNSASSGTSVPESGGNNDDNSVWTDLARPKGGSENHNNLQPYQTINFIIKT